MFIEALRIGTLVEIDAKIGIAVELRKLKLCTFFVAYDVKFMEKDSALKSSSRAITSKSNLASILT